MKHHILAALAVTSLLLSACSVPLQPVQPAPSAPTAPAEEAASAPADAAAPAETLGNLTYSGVFPDQTITLTDGRAAYEEEGPGTPYVQLVDELIPTGDLDGNGTEDAAVLLLDHSSGSGDFTYLAAVLDVATTPAPTPALMIGDRIEVKSLAIEGEQVVAELIAQGPGDPACCPSWNVRKVFTLQDGALAESASEELSRVALADLHGTRWRLVDLGENQESVLPDTEITLAVEDGQISGFAGCNQYDAALTGDAEVSQSFQVGPIAATQMLCPDAIAAQEAAYLALLASVQGWRYDGGHLTLAYPGNDDIYSYLRFAPQAGGAALAAPSDGATVAAGHLPRFEPLDECFAQPPADLPVEFDMDCGFVVVPEFYHGASSREMKLGVTRLNSGSGTAASPLFMLAGGPGQAQINPDFLRLFQPELLGRILDQRDIVVVEQRGTEFTDSFLDCPAALSLPWAAHQQRLSGAEADAFAVETIQTCIADFKAQGINFDAYNSVENAADVNAVREALGYDRIIYYGASYGSQLGQHVMRDFPETLEAVVLDGANALSRKSWVEDRALDAQWGIDHLTALCAADEKCAAAYDIPALVDAALGLFDNGPLPYTYTDPADAAVTVEGEVTVQDMVDLIYELQGDRIGAMGLPATLLQLTAGGAEQPAEILGALKANKLLASRTATESPMAFLMHMAMVCSDDPVHSTSDVYLEGVGSYATLFGQAMAKEYTELCSLIGVQELPDSTDVDVTLDVPTLLLTGDLDVATPTFRSQLVADALPNATMLVFPGRTHVQIGAINLCAAQIMTEFVLDPASAPDASCTAEAPLLGFILPDGTISR